MGAGEFKTCVSASVHLNKNRVITFYLSDEYVRKFQGRHNPFPWVLCGVTREEFAVFTKKMHLISFWRLILARWCCRYIPNVLRKDFMASLPASASRRDLTDDEELAATSSPSRRIYGATDDRILT